MDALNTINHSYENRIKRQVKHLKWRLLHIDPPLFFSLILLSLIGLFILYSASNENMAIIEKQIFRFAISFVLMIFFAQISPHRYQQWAPWLFFLSLFLLSLVLIIGHVDQGAKRWISLGWFHFQPSEIMKIALPLMLASYLGDKAIPPKGKIFFMACLIVAIPVILTVKQPDLGTAIIITCSAVSVLVLAGMSWRLIITLTSLGIASTPILWHFMHAYQKNRVLTFLNPERNPLGSGYHIIQSKIAIGSGGILGKGWLNGTQSHLSFLPAHATDFIFAVSGEELGLLGCSFIVLVFLFIFSRCIYISSQAQNTFTRLFAGSISITFLLSALVNIGMVIGILPVVGIPLPLISYGGSSMLTSFIGFGIIMSIHTHRKLWSS